MKIIGHRGAPDHAPENTMAGFQHAIASGADGIEFDVHRSADGAFVVIHDCAVDRTTNGSGLVSHLGFGHLQSLDAGSWFGDRFQNERIPSLERVLAMPDVEFELEVKTFDAADLAELSVRVTSAGVLDRLEFTSSNAPMLMALKAQNAGARIGVFSPRRQEWMVDEIFASFVISRADFAGADVVHVHAEDLTASLADRLHSGGYVVHANDASSAELIAMASANGADRTTTNDPSMAHGVIGAEVSG